MTTNRITDSSLAGTIGTDAINRALASPRVAKLAKALDIDLANDEQLAPALAKAMAILDRTSAWNANGSGDVSAADETANPLLAAAAINVSPAKGSSLSAVQIRAALRAYRIVEAL